MVKELRGIKSAQMNVRYVYRLRLIDYFIVAMNINILLSFLKIPL
jgi:hypothetical protein